jgi:ectoine hydroxylase-related dioxygenase (phytanoyl-CoA dioxygenase family)
MTVDPEQLLSDGYIILHDVIPSDEIEKLRLTFETLVTRQRELWSRERKVGDPPGGVWESGAQPRLQFDTLVSKDTSAAAEFCLHQNTMGVSRQIMRSKLASSTGMMLMCNPVRNHGPAPWHRDIHPIDQAPLSGLQHDLLQNAPGYVQWNIPLYDDEVLWVIPGSHKRVNTPEENSLLNENPRQPLPNGLQVKLQAGDGVVYTNTILHWGSNYSTRLRRTIHLGYRSFGGPIFPYVNRMLEDLGFTGHLPSESQALFEEFEEAYSSETDVLTGLFRAVLDRDEVRFTEWLSALHPGQDGRIVCCVLLSKIVYKLRFGTHPKREAYGGDISQDGKLATRFSETEIETLWQRFSELDQAIQSEGEQFVPGFQSGPMKYNFNDMPPNFGLSEFMASWA